jgi:prohibitin 1
MAQFLNRIGQLGLGVAVIGGVVNSALYNGNKINRAGKLPAYYISDHF